MVMILPIKQRESIKQREYYCPLCGNKEMHSTNHIGEIYSNCKVCGNDVLYCKDNEENLQVIKYAYLEKYEYNLEDIIQAKLYKLLERELKGIGYKKFPHRPIKYREVEEYEKIGPIPYIEIYEDLGNQYVTDRGRLHNWLEFTFDNKNIKEGYYLRFKNER
jgi:hypothetical protein